MIYTFLPLWQQVTKKTKMHSVMCLSGLIFGRWCRENSKDEGINGWCWSWWSRCWRWYWSCCWCRWSSSCIWHRHSSWPLTPWHSLKCICGCLASLLLPPEAAQLLFESQLPLDQEHTFWFLWSSPSSPSFESGWASPSQTSRWIGSDMLTDLACSSRRLEMPLQQLASLQLSLPLPSLSSHVLELKMVHFHPSP